MNTIENLHCHSSWTNFGGYCECVVYDFDVFVRRGYRVRANWIERENSE